MNSILNFENIHLINREVYSSTKYSSDREEEYFLVPRLFPSVLKYIYLTNKPPMNSTWAVAKKKRKKYF